jgi:general secretion pathway protein M
MNTSTTAPQQSKRVGDALAPLRARWNTLGAREKRLLTVAGWVVGALLVWLVAVQPALRAVRAAPARLDQLDAQMQQMQRLAGEARGLRDTPPVGAMQAQAAVKAAGDGLEGAARTTLAGERATVTFTNVNVTDLREWLSEVRGSARARPIEANLTRNPQGLFSGTVVLALPSGNAP